MRSCNLKKCLLFSIFFVLYFCISNFTTVSAANLNITDAQDLVDDIKIGWNLGNSLECYSDKDLSANQYEMSWGSPAVTQGQIHAIKEAGFSAVRIPITYKDHINAEGSIDTAWLKRISEVISYVLNEDMYCIINIHHDTGSGAWLTADSDKYESTSASLKNIWSQVATYLKDYDNRLLFEGFNEILNSKNQWSLSDTETLNTVNKLNQDFVDTVRKSGKQNASRFLICNTYAAGSVSSLLDNYRLPTDTVANHIIAGVHTYATTKDNIDSLYTRIKNSFCSRNIPVIIGEFGMKYSSSTENTRITNMSYYIQKGKELGISCFWWDDCSAASTASSVTNYAILNRRANTLYFPKLVENLIVASNTEKKVDDNTNDNKDETDSGTDVSEQSLEYVETLSNSGYIDTGIVVDSNSKIELVMAPTVLNNYGNMLYAYTSSSAMIRFRQETSNLAVAYSWYNSNVKSWTIGEKVTILQDGNKTYINDSLVRTATKINFSVSNTLKLGSCKMRIYSCKIWQGDTLLCDLKPITDSKGIVALYDNVTKKNFYNTETMTAGPVNNSDSDNVPPEEVTPTVTEVPTQEVTPTTTVTPTQEVTPTVTEIPTQEVTPTVTEVPTQEVTPTQEATPTITDVPNIEDNITPLEYAQVVTSSSYIDTGVSLNSKSQIEFTVSLPSQNTYGNLLYAQDNTSARFLFRQELSKLTVAYGWYNKAVYDITPDEIFTIHQDANVTYINDSIVQNATKMSFTLDSSLKFGGCKMNIYSCKVWDESELIHNYVPVLDKDGTVAFYDEITEEFLYSTKTLVAGPIME